MATDIPSPGPQGSAVPAPPNPALPPADAAAAVDPPQNPTALRLFLIFSQLGLSSFGGGVSAWVHRAFVEHRGWIGEKDFAAMLAICRVLPGTNVANLAVLIGQRSRGLAGAAAALLGLLLGPTLLVIAIAAAYRRVAGATLLHALFGGAAAAAVGLLIVMAIRSEMRSGNGRTGWLVLAGTFVVVGVLRVPLVPAVLCLVPVSVLLTRRATAKAGGEAPDE
ncbi:MAG: chromate transporter [Rhodoplanes sp.]|uniref:chromate transporter n=1 Tax=Rhodoplanes sp. TaxID=1968906 RepID=UPI0017F52F2A|nr:chromate transporter [Rhodoplanes sp.]NVO13041.1 chromate transporter [Rhodoplanes sp.]